MAVAPSGQASCMSRRQDRRRRSVAAGGLSVVMDRTGPCTWNVVDAPGVPRVAPQDPPHSQSGATHRTVRLDRDHRVARAGRVEAAPGRRQRRDEALVQTDGPEQEPGEKTAAPRSCHRRLDRRVVWSLCGGHEDALVSLDKDLPRQASRSVPSLAKSASADAGRARTTTRLPGGSVDMRVATSARRRRFTLLRTTAFPTALDTTKPTDGASLPAPEGETWTTMVDFPVRTPPRTARLKSPGRRMRCAAGSTELRQRARNGPCGDELRGSRDPHGCACAAGSRGSSHDAGCSAGRSAWSRGTPKHVGEAHPRWTRGTPLRMSCMTSPEGSGGMRKRRNWLSNGTWSGYHRSNPRVGTLLGASEPRSRGVRRRSRCTGSSTGVDRLRPPVEAAQLPCDPVTPGAGHPQARPPGYQRLEQPYR